MVISILIGIITGILSGLISGTLVTGYYRVKDKKVREKKDLDVAYRKVNAFFYEIMALLLPLDNQENSTNDIINLKSTLAKELDIVQHMEKIKNYDENLFLQYRDATVDFASILSEPDVDVSLVKDLAHKSAKFSFALYKSWGAHSE